GQPIGHLEAMSYYVIVATAGHDTTSSTAAGGLLALMQNPEQFAKLKADPDKYLNGAIDEMIRWTTPVKHFFRTAAVGRELRGKRIKPGDSLLMGYWSADRDEDAFDAPFTCNIERSPNKPLAFGYGADLCLDQHLAKMEIKALFKELLARL